MNNNNNYKFTEQEQNILNERMRVKPSIHATDRTKYLPAAAAQLNENIINNIKKLPPQTRVAIGNHSEEYWRAYQEINNGIASLDGTYNFQDGNLVNVNTDAETIDNNDYITDDAYPVNDDIARYMSMQQMQRQQFATENNTQQHTNNPRIDVAAAQKTKQNIQNTTAKKDNTSIPGVNINNYVILYKGKTIASDISKKEVENIINRIIFDNVIPGYEEQVKSEFVIFKRIDFSIRTIINDE